MGRRDRVLAAARAAIGCPTRPQGRSRTRGLDCAGLVAAALAEAGCTVAVPAAYSLKSDNRARLAAGLAAAGLSRSEAAAARAGDILEFEVGPAQHHLAVNAAGTIIHADFSLGRVVEASAPPEWRLVAAWRIAEAD